MAEPRTLVTGLVVGESPRWHDGRLWYANWGAQEIRTVDDSGSGEVIAMVRRGGTATQVADNLAFPNGMVITPDNSTLVIAESWANKLSAFDIESDGTLSNRRVWAEVSADGICLDAEGAIWCPGVSGNRPECLRVREGGEVLQRITLDRACFACMLGGEDGRTLFLMTAEWRGVERMGELFRSQTGQVQAMRVDLPHAGRP